MVNPEVLLYVDDKSHFRGRAKRSLVKLGTLRLIGEGKDREIWTKCIENRGRFKKS